MEYFAGGTCEGIGGPFFNSRKTIPSQAYPSYGANSAKGACLRSDVSACVPGVGCGSPNVLLRGGVARNTTDKTPLWGSGR